MSERRSAWKRPALGVAVALLGAWAAWWAWRPSCYADGDDWPRSLAEIAASADARERESGCFGLSMQCHFRIKTLDQGQISVIVERSPLSGRSCDLVTDNTRVYFYSPNGGFQRMLLG